jgi:hypothetical protein
MITSFVGPNLIIGRGLHALRHTTDPLLLITASRPSTLALIMAKWPTFLIQIGPLRHDQQLFRADAATQPRPHIHHVACR